MKADYYETLGVQRGADAAQLKAAFRKLAMQFHPDRNPGDKAAEARFKEINEAYECLKDSDRRAAYDRYGHAGADGGRSGMGNSFEDIFQDIFGSVFGGVGGSRRAGTQLRGADLRCDVEISLEEAFSGKHADIRFSASAACERCSGSGARPGAKPVACQECGGHGKVRMSQGFFTVERTCPHCGGRGTKVSDPCPDCGGAGHVAKERSIVVNVPAGIEDGTRIRLSGEGAAGVNGGVPGDLYVFVSVKPDKRFRREGADLHCEETVSISTAALGGSLEVGIPGGEKAKVKIPEGMQSGHVFRLKGKGMPILRQSSRGDLHVKVSVETPRKMSRQQKELLREFEALSA